MSTAGDRPRGVVCDKGGVRKCKILLNCHEVCDVEREGDEGEERHGENR